VLEFWEFYHFFFNTAIYFNAAGEAVCLFFDIPKKDGLYQYAPFTISLYASQASKKEIPTIDTMDMVYGPC